MNEDIKRRWVQALRSGKYQQGRSALNMNNQRLCCLGVLCEIAVEDGILNKRMPDNMVEYSHTTGPLEYLSYLLSNRIVAWAGMNEANPLIHDGDMTLSLTGWNDSGEADFNKIANLIEEHL